MAPQCSGHEAPPPRPLFTSVGCMYCATSTRPAGCSNESDDTCRTQDYCCVEVSREVPPEVKQEPDPLASLKLPVDPVDFIMESNRSAVLGVLSRPFDWPLETDVAHCQRRCWSNGLCYLYTYFGNKFTAGLEWRHRCVTWDERTAAIHGRAAPSSWTPEAFTYSGAKKAKSYSDIVITIRTAEDEGSTTTGPFALFVCSAPDSCAEHSPIAITSDNCEAAVNCFLPGATSRYVTTIAIPKGFRLHKVRFEALTDDPWTVESIVVDLEGMIGIYRGKVTLSQTNGPWHFDVGCVTTSGWGSTAVPGTPCGPRPALSCYIGFGPHGWCWVDKDHSAWGSCAPECHRYDEVKTFSKQKKTSTLSCAELDWPSWSPYNSDRSVCSSSKDVPLSACSGELTWVGAKQFCEGVGARLCTEAELEANEAAGTGCDYDGQLIWSSTSCKRGSYAVRTGKASLENSSSTTCLEATLQDANARCCADARRMIVKFERSQRDAHSLPGRMKASSKRGLAEWQVVEGTNRRGDTGFFLQSGMLDDQAPFDDQSVDVILENVPVAERGGEIEFWFRIDSEREADQLHFYIDGQEVFGVFPASGKIDWTIARFPFPPLKDGRNLHTFLWRYQKDATYTYGRDIACIDEIVVYGIVGNNEEK
eukprot:TRINITY_DN54658_c0_g1_i1.p1 TRINITY_DN54658_c0_g1~~TRINITY_DN54658_c0_g1_i1.p1  ORF type:complete len:664 (-),score=99.28 TRINITY_DN54658_c0_g1_i1:341-2284(-)